MRECVPGVPCNSECEYGCDRIGAMTHPFDPDNEHSAHFCSDHRWGGNMKKCTEAADEHVRRVQAARDALILSTSPAAERDEGTK